jgi:hypothetical protein
LVVLEHLPALTTFDPKFLNNVCSNPLDLRRGLEMDMVGAEKLQNALHEIELLRSDFSGEEAESLERLRSFLCSALGWAELLADLQEIRPPHRAPSRGSCPNAKDDEWRWGRAMALTQSTLRTLIKLVQAKLSSMEVVDREDRRERKFLQAYLSELQKMQQTSISEVTQAGGPYGAIGAEG